ncbi:hypothetical protein EDC40_10276 [Aminobacter aminovorans]|uniref:Lipoprotein n=1 Tax=Aminobacter aminovorans TaxID=83263 RepID=A0A380WHM5_AMIAI|nr:hypothetical protein [Aminobacter aminovorans]TCS28639.1 hypothetical protein EDC40_10276 [Aminobacter aminovorans]SUU88493.1 Uncharacterised protein [Aminobacter aminovorans]
MKVKLHAVAGGVALLTVSCFWISTVAAELTGSAEIIATVKASVLAGMAVLVPAMIIAGGTGFSLGKGWKRPVVQHKKRRMRVIAANGLLVLLPSAYLLAGWAAEGRFDAVFIIVQTLELAAGAVNIALLSLNMRDGLALRRKPARAVRAG